MSNQKSINTSLLFFLNGILGSVLNTLKGGFDKRAKLEFNKIVKQVNKLDKNLQKGINYTDSKKSYPESRYTYTESTVAIAEVLNEAMGAYYEEELYEFVQYCRKFKREKL